MARKSVLAAAKAKRLVEHQAKRWVDRPLDSNPLPLETTSSADPAPLLANLSISEQELPPINEHCNNPELEVDPEDLPLKDPPTEAEILDDDLIIYENGRWEHDLSGEAELRDSEDFELRVDNKPIPADERDKLILKLEAIERESYRGKGKKRRSIMDELTLSRVRVMTASLRLLREMDSGLIRASYLAAVATGRSKPAAASVRHWIRDFWRTGSLPANLYGQWNESIIEDEDLKLALQEHLRCIGRYASPQDVVSFFNTAEGKKFAHLLDEPPSLRTAQRWMPILGYHWKTERQGQFADGHEREDVVDFRMNVFIPEWDKYERRMRTWDRDGNEIPPDLQPGEKEVVVHWHDETIFRGHERQMTRWIPEWEKPGLYKKGEGPSLMVADMISAKYGWLRRPSNEKDTVRVLFRPGKERDGWFCTPDVCVQLRGGLQIVTEELLHEEHIFMFDNATTHTKLPDDAPPPSRMTLGPSHKVGGECITPEGDKVLVKFAPAQLPDGSIQDFYYPLNHQKKKLRGAFKGLAKLLEERGVPGARKLKLICPKTKGRTGCAGRKDCCARTIMVNQPDILGQKTILQLLAESYGCRVFYLPKFHCELNPIEQCWAVAKSVYRKNPMSSLEADLIRNAVAALDTVKLSSIRRFVGRSR